MAEVVKEMPPERFGKRGRPCPYPWDKWLDGQVWKLQKGIDFDVPRHKFSNAARNAATYRDMRVTIRSIGTELYLKAEKLPVAAPSNNEDATAATESSDA